MASTFTSGPSAVVPQLGASAESTIVRPPAFASPLRRAMLGAWLAAAALAASGPVASGVVVRQFAALPARDADFVPSLPSWGPPPTDTYSGFLNADAVEPGTRLHYQFIACSDGGDPAATPVVLWMNGGPGSSSYLGLLQELGPLMLNATGGLFHNPYAWTTRAHLLILESPAGVGYSYCAAQLSGGSCANTDISTARAARAAVVDFYTRLFPELRKSELWLTGESYAGVYVPTLAKELLEHADRVVPLAGLAVGDPCTDNECQADSMDMVWYIYVFNFVLSLDRSGTPTKTVCPRCRSPPPSPHSTPSTFPDRIWSAAATKRWIWSGQGSKGRKVGIFGRFMLVYTSFSMCILTYLGDSQCKKPDLSSLTPMVWYAHKNGRRPHFFLLIAFSHDLGPAPVVPFDISNPSKQYFMTYVRTIYNDLL
ncbi:serine carboxypeptidase-domain-containing protein [Pavlovales sp. CCMP2436]|nr:serine carboxypeptidase-domain-containing protein [Pavlovales sp. CCMP2436]